MCIAQIGAIQEDEGDDSGYLTDDIELQLFARFAISFAGLLVEFAFMNYLVYGRGCQKLGPLKYSSAC